MMTTAKLLCVFCALVLLSGCVSTSSGSANKETDNVRAAEMNYELGARYYRAGNYNFARDRLLRALEFNPELAIAHTTLAWTYLELENPRLATEHFGKAVRAEPDNFDIRNHYAVFLCQQAQFDEARKQFDRAISAYDNDNAEVMLTNAGTCMANKPDYALAEEYFRRALDFKASYGEALIQLASVKHRTGDNLRARAFLQRYLAANPTTASALFLGVEIEKALDDKRASTDFVNQLLREFPNSPEALYLMDRSASR